MWINNLLAYLICTEENQGESYVESQNLLINMIYKYFKSIFLFYNNI